jgi:DNA-binding MarR family transcriptional regulator
MEKLRAGDCVDVFKGAENQGTFQLTQRPRDKCKYAGWVHMNTEHEPIFEMIARLKTINEWRVFWCVAQALTTSSYRAEITQSDISELLGIDAADVSRALKKLLNAPPGLEPMLRRYDGYFAVNPRYASVGDTDTARAVWRKAEAREAALAQRKARIAAKKAGGVNVIAFSGQDADCAA